MRKKFGIRQEGYVDETCGTRPMYRRVEENQFEFVGFENGIRPEQLTESTRKYYENRAKKAVLQGNLFDTSELLPT